MRYALCVMQKSVLRPYPTRCITSIPYALCPKSAPAQGISENNVTRDKPCRRPELPRCRGPASPDPTCTRLPRISAIPRRYLCIQRHSGDKEKKKDNKIRKRAQQSLLRTLCAHAI